MPSHASKCLHLWCRYLRAAAHAKGKKRLNLLAEHVLDVWLWTLAQVSAWVCEQPVQPRFERRPGCCQTWIEAERGRKSESIPALS